MNLKTYHSLEINLLWIEEEDIVTASAGIVDSNKDDDITQGDIFGQ